MFCVLFLLQQQVFKILENDPLFARQPGEDVPVEKKRELNFLRYLPNNSFESLVPTCRVLVVLGMLLIVS